LLAPPFLVISPYKIFCGEFSLLIFHIVSEIPSLWEKYERSKMGEQFAGAPDSQRKASSAASFLLRVSLAAMGNECKRQAA
jgi:hypothetical protein